MKKTNTALKLLPVRNPLEEYKYITEQIKALEASKNGLREEILALMEASGSSSLIVGQMKAQMTSVEQYRVDTKKVKEMLGDRYDEVTTVFTQVRLTVI